MAYFRDLSEYAYRSENQRPRTKNIGWLVPEHAYSTGTPTEETLDLLWDYCTISTARTRGIHECEFCTARDSYLAERRGQKLLLGTSEIRVFGANGDIYAAPTLIYHYVSVHHYRPPDQFVRALKEGPKPPSPEYFQLLEKLHLDWAKTSVPNGTTVGLRLRPDKTKESNTE